MASTYNNAAPPKQPAHLSVVKQTAFSSARDVFNEVARLEARIESIVNACVGHPTEACAEAAMPRPEPRGVFDDLGMRASDAASAISRIDSTLSRLEREF